MLGKKSIYRKPVVILASIVVLLLLNLAVVNNPIFATRVSDLTAQTETVAEMSVDESNAQLAEIADPRGEQGVVDNHHVQQEQDDQRGKDDDRSSVNAFLTQHDLIRL